MEDVSLQVEVRQLAKAIRFAFVAVVLVLSYFTVRASLHIGAFEQIFRDMLNGKPLPAVTQFMIAARWLLLGTSLLFPAMAVATLFSQRLVASFYVLGILALLTVGQTILVCEGLFAPLTQIMTTMQGG